MQVLLDLFYVFERFILLVIAPLLTRSRVDSKILWRRRQWRSRRHKQLTTFRCKKLPNVPRMSLRSPPVSLNNHDENNISLLNRPTTHVLHDWQRQWKKHWMVINWTRKLCYRKDDRALKWPSPQWVIVIRSISVLILEISESVDRMAPFPVGP